VRFRENNPQDLPRARAEVAAWRAQYPTGTMQARIPKPDGETVITRYTLHDLLDKLGELTAGGDEAKGG
jgi:hypothetical protein